jgi:hypothetical protein
MKHYICIFALMFSHFAHSEDDNPALDLMVISKMTGVCGVMFQMAEFQRSTQMLGGTNFIARFWKTEFARLGKTQEQFLEECKMSISAYDKYMKTLEEIQQ